MLCTVRSEQTDNIARFAGSGRRSEDRATKTQPVHYRGRSGGDVPGTRRNAATLSVRTNTVPAVGVPYQSRETRQCATSARDKLEADRHELAQHLQHPSPVGGPYRGRETRTVRGTNSKAKDTN
ncbi:unnamed protein product, partial [Iphiclides podalirius]